MLLRRRQRVEWCFFTFVIIRTNQDRVIAGIECQLFDIGGHTVSHPVLPFYNEDIQQKEIVGNKLLLEQITEKKIDLFAYPSGKYNDLTNKILNQMGFEAAFTTNAKRVKKYANPFTLGRFQVTNYSGDQLKHQLLNWFAQ